MKRILDFALALLSLFFLSPLLLFLALLVRFRLGTPVVFRQQRPGLSGRPFVLYKFRSLTEARDCHGNLLPDADRILFGRGCGVPRSMNYRSWEYSGDMSFVGHVPCLCSIYPHSLTV